MLKSFYFGVTREQGDIAAVGFHRAVEQHLMPPEQGLTLGTGVVIYWVIWGCRAQLWRVTGRGVVKGQLGEMIQERSVCEAVLRCGDVSATQMGACEDAPELWRFATNKL